MSRQRTIRRLRRKHARAAAGSKRESAAKRKLDALLAREAPLPVKPKKRGRWDDVPYPVYVRLGYISPQGTLKGQGLERTRFARKCMELKKPTMTPEEIREFWRTERKRRMVRAEGRKP